MKSITIRFLSKFKDLTNKDKITLDLTDNYDTLSDLMKKLKEIFEINFRDLIFEDDEKLKSEIIVLKNDREFSILSEKDKILQDKDMLVFMSTIHGG